MALLSGNCPLITERLENSERNLKYLIFINLCKINFEQLCISSIYFNHNKFRYKFYYYYQKYSYLLTYLLKSRDVATVSQPFMKMLYNHTEKYPAKLPNCQTHWKEETCSTQVKRTISQYRKYCATFLNAHFEQVSIKSKIISLCTTDNI